MKTRFLTIVLILGLIGLFTVASESYAAISPTPKELASLDSDKDGYSDLCEVLHKTDPNDTESKPSANITINVPAWRIPSKRTGAFKPKNVSNNLRCPVLETGSHSVKP